jgi:hypothetical protein
VPVARTAEELRYGNTQRLIHFQIIQLVLYFIALKCNLLRDSSEIWQGFLSVSLIVRA